MDADAKKFLWGLIGFVLAGLAAYAIAAMSIQKLNEKVLTAAEEIGGSRERMKILEEDARRLRTQLATLEKEAEETAKRFRDLANSDTGKIASLAKQLNELPSAVALLTQVETLQKQKIGQCRVQAEAIWSQTCSPGQLSGGLMPVVSSDFTPVGGGTGQWSPWQIASEWDGAPWNCMRLRLECRP